MRKAVMELIKRGVMLTLMFAFGSANAATWYVDAATGSSSHSGKSMLDAFSSIQTAIGKAAEDDVIIVNDGIYSPITVEKRITIQSVNGQEKTFIDGAGKQRCATLMSGSSWKTQPILRGFTLKNGYASSNGGGVRDGTVIDCIITDCKSTDHGAGACDTVLFNCIVENNKNTGTYGTGGGLMWCNAYNCIIRNNMAYDGGGVYSSYTYSSLIVDNMATRGGGSLGGKLYNCTVVHNIAPTAGGDAWGDLVNCIVWDNYSDSSRSTINNYYAQSVNHKYTCTYPLTSGTGNMSSNPHFVDMAHGDYRLSPNSPCLDSGINLQSHSDYGAMLVDVSGLERIRNGRIDMGAYEYQIGSVPVPMARNWYVNATIGDNANDGLSPCTPFKDIMPAVICSLDDDVINVSSGVYSRISVFDKRINIRGVDGWRNCVIEGNTGSCVFADSTNAVVSTFTLRNGSYGTYGGTCVGCVITGNGGDNITGAGACSANLINCIVYGNFTQNGKGGGTSYCYLRNCVVTKNRAAVGGGSNYDYHVYNTIVWGNTANTDSDVTDIGGWWYCSCTGEKVRGDGNIVENPKFVDWENDNFRLCNDSPCINAGKNTYVRGKYDLDGNHRIKDKVVDMGAFENQTANPYVEVGYASAQQRYPWNGLVDVQFDVFGMVSNEVTNVVLSASGDVVKDLAMATFTQSDVSGLSNGTWHCVWDAGTDVPRVLDSNLVVRVALPDGDSCAAEATKLDTRSQPRDAAGSEDLLVSAAWQDEVPPENVTASLTQTPPGYRATKLAEFTGDAVQKVTWDAAGAAVSGVHLFTLTLKENDTGRVLKTMTSSFNVAGEGSEPQPVFTDDPLTIPMEFSSWSALSTFLNDSRAAFLRVNGMTVVPPTTNVVMISLGEFAVPLSMLSSTEEPVEAVEEYGVKVYRLHIREMGDGTSDLVATVGGVPVSLLSMPPYNPDRWVEALYGMPPAYLTGEERAKWYAERDVARVEWFMTLVPQSDIASYRANRAAALFETVKEQPEIGIGGLTTKTDGETLHSVTVNVKEDSVVDVFGKRTLNETNWTYAGRAFIPAGESAVGVVSDSLSYFMTVVRAGGTAEGGGAVVTEGDSDHDGIPDTVEKMTYGTNPHLADTSGGGIPDWTKIYVYGLNPLVTDTDGDGYDDIEELMSGTDPKVPLPGADTSIRYYYDEDDQLIRVHCGATGAMFATELTPNGNPKTVKERRATK